mmetsp:Transcript_2837/g.4260  ORF Transcript_2837/g.4260 Transcript_2837/m.4260 type:complete len:471 (+) Transcript_2837:302-1714(+)
MADLMDIMNPFDAPIVSQSNPFDNQRSQYSSDYRNIVNPFDNGGIIPANSGYSGVNSNKNVHHNPFDELILKNERKNEISQSKCFVPRPNIHQSPNAQNRIAIPSIKPPYSRQNSGAKNHLESTRSVSLNFRKNSDGNLVFDPWNSPTSPNNVKIHARPPIRPFDPKKDAYRRHRSTSPKRKSIKHSMSAKSLLNMHSNRKNSFDIGSLNISDEDDSGDACTDDLNEGVDQKCSESNIWKTIRSDDIYTVEFTEADKKLGMLLERKDEWPKGTELRKERAVVILVFDMGPARYQGVTEGSKVIAVNNVCMEDSTYTDILQAIKHAPRPMKISFLRGSLGNGDDNAGHCLYKTCTGLPRSYKVWKSRYYVMGGALARLNVLQLYPSKQAFDHIVINVFQGVRPKHNIKCIKLSSIWICGPIKVKQYDQGPPLNYFYIKKNGWHFKQMNFASTDMAGIEKFREQIIKLCQLS